MAYKLPYPSVTICEDIPDQTLLDDIGILFDLNPSRIINFRKLEGPQSDYVTNMSSSMARFIKYCANGNELIPCDDYIVPKMTKVGLCYTFNSYERVQTKGDIHVSTAGTRSAVAFYIQTSQDNSRGITVS